MSWNYRVIRRTFPNEFQYTIHEVYYDETGKPNGMTENEVSPSGESIEALKQSMENYRRAIDKPALDFDTLEEIEG